MTRYTITGIFAIDTEAEDPREARSQAERRLRKAGFQGCAVEVEVNEREGETKCLDETKTPEIGRNQNP